MTRTEIKRYKYYIGIDCGVNTGYSVYDKPQKKLLQVCSMNIIQAMQAIKVVAMNNPDELYVRIEDPRLRKWIPQQKDEKAERGRNRGAGSVMRDAQIWQEFLEMEKIPYEMVAPKNNKTKTSAEYFKKVTGWQLGTNGRHLCLCGYLKYHSSGLRCSRIKIK